MAKRKSEARLRWEEEYRQRRADATWERMEEFLARNPMSLSPRAMAPKSAGLVAPSVAPNHQSLEGDPQ
jgi:hypothetical protein